MKHSKYQLSLTNAFTELSSNSVLVESYKTRQVCCCFLRLASHFFYQSQHFTAFYKQRKCLSQKIFLFSVENEAGNTAFQNIYVPLLRNEGKAQDYRNMNDFLTDCATMRPEYTSALKIQLSLILNVFFKLRAFIITYLTFRNFKIYVHIKPIAEKYYFCSKFVTNTSRKEQI